MYQKVVVRIILVFAPTTNVKSFYIADASINQIRIEEASKIKTASKAWYKTMISDSDYAEFDVITKWLGVSQ
ncbi:hypothetical protein Tco_1402937 [Tanacetum coccineum]